MPQVKHYTAALLCYDTKRIRTSGREKGLDSLLLKSQLALARTIPGALIVTDSDCRITFANRAARKLFRLRSSEMIGRSLNDPSWKLTTADGQPVPCDDFSFAGVISSKKVLRDVELLYELPGGQRLTLIFDAAPFPDGNATNVILLIADATRGKQAVRELEASYQTQNVLSSLMALAIAGTPLVEQINQALDIILSTPFMKIMPKGGIFLTENGSRELVLRASRNLPESLLKICARVPFGECLCGRAAASKRVIFAGQVDHRHDHRYESMVPYGHYVAPILSKVDAGKVLGVLVLYVGAGHRRNVREEQFLRAVVDTLAGMIERKNRERESRRAKELSDALNSINAAMTSTLDIDKTMNRVIEQATATMGCESGRVVLREEAEWVVRYISGIAPEVVGTRFSDAQARGAVHAAQTMSAFVVNDAFHDARVNREVVKGYSIRSMLAVPIITREKATGAIVFQCHSAPIGFDEAQVDFAETLAASVSLAMENARLFDEEHRIADTLQESLLTIPKQIKGVDFGYLYRSATEAARVGGDFYDLFELDAHRVAIIVGDVSGKGIESAVTTAIVKGTLKAFAMEETSPAIIVSNTNNLVMKVTGEAIFITLFFGILDKRTGRLVYCSAGHPEAIIKKGPRTLFLVTDSPALLPVPGCKYTDNEKTMSKGDILVLYSDGITEAKNNQRVFFGQNRLRKVISDTQRPTRQLSKAIFDELMRFTGGTLNDHVRLCQNPGSVGRWTYVG